MNKIIRINLLIHLKMLSHIVKSKFLIKKRAYATIPKYPKIGLPQKVDTT